MASTCSVCPKGTKTSAPMNWCPDCNNLLCKSCTGHHSRSSSSKDHKVIPHTDYQKLPPFILKIRPYCTKHNQRFSEFCRHHDTPICITCLKKDHRKCDDMPKIEDIVHKVKDSVLFEDTMTELEAVCGNLKKIAVDRIKNVKHLNKTHKKIKAGVEKKVDNLIKHITNLKNKTLSEMDSMYNKLVNDISKTAKSVQSKEEELRAILDQKDDILKYASNFQTFIGVKEMETIINEVNIYLNELSNDEKLMEYDLKFKENESIEDIVSGIQSLGDIQVTKSPSAVSIQNTEARYLEAVKEVQGGVHLHLQQRIELEDDHDYHGCCTLPGGLVVIADYGDIDDNDCKILIHKSDGSLRSTIKFDKSEGVFDVTPEDDHHVAVSHPRTGTISIIDVDSDQVVRKLQVGEGVRGLCCRGRDIVCCVWDKGLVRVNIYSGKVETVVEDRHVDWKSHVEVSNNLICYTCPDIHRVKVLDTQYNVIFTYKNKAVLRQPTGVTIDDHSNIYVTGFRSHNLVMISSDGKSCHQLLGRDDGLVYPNTVHYDSSTKRLVVVNRCEGPAYIYSVE